MKDKKVVFLFGRFQVPTAGHAEMIMYGIDYARRTGAEFRLYTSKSQDGVKNPLPYHAKVTFLRQLFPGINVVDDPSAVSAFAICRKLSDQGYTDVTMVVGGDRVQEFKNGIGRYVMDKKDPNFDPKKNYAFKKFNVVNSGNRKAGVSGTQMREFIKSGKFNEFMKIAPTKDKKLAKTIFDTAKKHLIKEDTVEEATTREITKHLSSNGWKLHRQGGNHEVWAHEKSGKRIAVPRHRGDLKKGLAQGIMKSAMIAEGMSRKDFEHDLKAFIKFACDHLGIHQYPRIKYKKPAEQGEQPSFAAYSPSEKLIYIMTKDRHPMDIMRSVAHELVHHKQNEDNRLGDVANAGSTGSDIENEANSEAGIIMRKFGKLHPHMFAKSHITEETLNEGIYDPNIFKCIFLAGGAGSGKDFILDSVIKGGDKYSNGLKELNVDQAFKRLLQKAGLDLRMPKSQEKAREPVRARAKAANVRNTEIKQGERLGLIINGTGDDYERMKRLKHDYEAIGYDTMLIFVSTTNEVSKQRNIERGQKGDREVDEKIRFGTWKDAMANKDRFAQLFGRGKFIAIDNSIDTRYATPDQKRMVERSHKAARTIVTRFLNAPVTSPVAQAWISAAKAKRGINEKFENMLNEVGGAGNWGTPMLTNRYKADTPGQEPGMTRQMGYYPAPPNVKVFGNAPVADDKITATTGSAKSVTFSGDTTGSDYNSILPMSPVDRWMMKEETRRQFKAKYGQLAEQKMRQTARRLKESQDKQ